MKHSYKRILVKLSGELLKSDDGAIDANKVAFVAEELRAAHALGVEIGVVIGAGNIIRGGSFSADSNTGILRTLADQAGMLATTVNAMVMHRAMKERNIDSVVLAAVDMPGFVEIFSPQRAEAAFKSGKVVFFAAGLGHPFFTTDTASAIRAVETGCEALFKATKVDGVYDKDPKKFDDAVRFDTISMSEALERRLAVMDQTAFAVCRENRLPIVVFKLANAGDLALAISGKGKFTHVLPD